MTKRSPAVVVVLIVMHVAMVVVTVTAIVPMPVAHGFATHVAIITPEAARSQC